VLHQSLALSQPSAKLRPQLRKFGAAPSPWWRLHGEVVGRGEILTRHRPGRRT